MSERLRIGLIGPGMAHEAFRPLVCGAARRAIEENHRLLVFGSERSLQGTVLRSEAFSEPEAAARFADPGVVDVAAVFAAGLMPRQSEADITDFIRRLAVPAVAVGMEVGGIPSVTVDYPDAMRQMINHIVDVHGARRIVYVGLSSGHPDEAKKLAGLRDAAGSVAAELLYDGLEARGDSPSAAAEALGTVLDGGSKPEAVFCGSDALAFAVIGDLAKRGIRVPDDVIVIGFGDSTFSLVSAPSITTLRLDLEALGARSADLCADLIHNGTADSSILNLTPAFRHSCGCDPWLSARPRNASVRHLPEFGFAVEAIDAAVESGDYGKLRRALTELTAGMSGRGNELLLQAVEESRVGPPPGDSSPNGIVVQTIVEMAAAKAEARRERSLRLTDKNLAENELVLGRRLDEVVDTDQLQRTAKRIFGHLGIVDHRLVRITGPNTAAVIASSDRISADFTAEGSELLTGLIAEVSRAGNTDTITAVAPLPFNADTLGYAILNLTPEQSHTVDTLALSLGSLLNRLRLNEMLDQTEAARRGAYRKQVEAQDQLVRNERLASLGRLVANVAHQLNTPVGIATTALSHLRLTVERIVTSNKASGCSPDDLETFATMVELIESSVRRTADIVGKFGSIVPSPGVHDEPEIDIRRAVDAVLVSLRSELRAADIRVEVSVPRPIFFCVSADSLERILFALMTNSIEHGFDGCRDRTIGIRVTGNADGATIEHSDNGNGVDHAVLADLFEPFFTTKRANGKLGLGLHAVHNLVTGTLKGTVKAESPPGKGLTILITLPAEAVCEDLPEQPPAGP